MFIKAESDLHTAIYEHYLEKPYEVDLTNIDTYIIAGDCCEESSSRIFITNTAKKYPNCNIIEVAGNHTYYRGNIEKVHNRKIELSNALSNYYFLENDSIVLDGIKFIGACFWTDMNNRDERVIHEAWSCMNDYRMIRYTENYIKLTPYRTIAIHENSKKYIEQELNNSTCQTNVVITHHQPFYSKPEHCYGDDLLSYAYGSELDEWLNTIDAPDYWISGHSHKSHDFTKKYNGGNIRFISNQLGYPSEEGKTGYNKEFRLEI